MDYLRPCLRSIYGNTHGLAFEIIVVDNASYDGCGEMLAREFPTVTFIQSHENVGFAKSNNLGWRKARANTILFLNPDTEITGAALEMMHAKLQSLPNPGAVGAKLLNGDGTVQTSCIQSFPTVVNQALDCEFLRKLSPRSPLWGMEPLWSGSPEGSAVDVISGAALMARRDALEQVRGFSEDYFMYAEDLDLCAKLHNAGLTNYYVPQATIIHYGGGSSSQSRSNFADVMMRESVCRFLKIHRGAVCAAAYRVTIGIVALVRMLLLIVSMVALKVSRNALRKWFAIFKWSVALQSSASGAATKKASAATARRQSAKHVLTAISK